MTNRIAALALTFALGCSYDFQNPAEQLGMGQALGRVVVDRAGSGARDPLPDVLVSLENSDAFDQVTRPTGRFTLLSLPVGRHNVLFRKGTTWASQRIVEIVPGLDGHAEGVNLGDVRLRYTVTLQGSFQLPAPPPGNTLVNAVWDVADEVSGQPAALAAATATEARYSFRGLAVGPHRIRFAVQGTLDDGVGGTTPVTYLGGPLTLAIPETSEGQLLQLNPVALSEPPAGGAGSVRFRVQVVAPVAVSPSSISVELHDPATFDPLTTATTSLVEVLTPDSAGYVQADVAAGLYLIRLVPPLFVPGSGSSVSLLAPDPLRTLVQDGQLTEFGTLYVADGFTAGDAAAYCFADADCGTGGACVGDACQGGTAPRTLPASFSTPFCFPSSECSNGCGACAIDSGFPGSCSEGPAGPGSYVCMPAGATECTPDGALLVAFKSSC